jgi:hypothetical protein
MLLAVALTGCSTVTVRAPPCEPPPLPPAVSADCPDLPPITDPSFSALFQQSLRDAVQYSKCRNDLRNYAALMAYRDSVCPKIQKQVQEDRPWWRLW